MRSHRCFVAWGWIAFLVLSCLSTFTAHAIAAGLPPKWKVFDVFQIAVKVYPRAADKGKPPDFAKEPMPITSFTVHAILLPVQPFEECGCWKLQFNSFSKLPEFKNPYLLWIDKKSGLTRKASHFVGVEETPLAPADVVPIFLDAPPGFPVEFIPDLENATLSTERKDTTVEIASHTLVGVIQRKAIVRVKGQAAIEIHQRWLPGAKWWSEYKRFYRGQLDLQASLIVPKAAPSFLPPPPAPKPPAGADLRSDPRLQVPISVDMAHRPLQDLLDLMGQKTNVELTMDSALAAVVPAFGSTSKRNVPAWEAMEGIARDFVVDGRWEKTGAGYQLSAREAVEPRRSRRSPDRERSQSMRLRAIIGGLAVAGIVVCWYFRRRSKQPAVPDSDKSGTA